MLIDEARTPLIISGPDERDTAIYHRFARARAPPGAGPRLHDRPHAPARCTSPRPASRHWSAGSGSRTSTRSENFRLTRYMEAALKAQFIYERDRDYVVKDGQIVIVDDFTGRLMEGRRWSDGLHQAVEAKEGVQIQQESITYATITLQNYFRMYDKLAGMTGTAVTEAEEFEEIYKLEVLVIPTHRPWCATTTPDLVYRTVEAKFNAVIDDIAEKYEPGGPSSSARSPSRRPSTCRNCSSDASIPHEVLNAKQHQREATIVARAGSAQRRHHRHEHGRPRHRHQARRGRRRPRRPARHRHRAPRVAAHRQPAARPRRPPGRPRLLALLRLLRGRPHEALRPRVAAGHDAASSAWRTTSRSNPRW